MSTENLYNKIKQGLDDALPGCRLDIRLTDKGVELSIDRNRIALHKGIYDLEDILVPVVIDKVMAEHYEAHKKFRYLKTPYGRAEEEIIHYVIDSELEELSSVLPGILFFDMENYFSGRHKAQINGGETDQFICALIVALVEARKTCNDEEFSKLVATIKNSVI